MSMRFALALLVLVELCATGLGQDAQVVALYEAKSQAIEVPDGEPFVLKYRLLKPAKMEANRRYPLVLFLHGAGERGDNNEKQLLYLPSWLAGAENREKYPCFVLAPQCPSGMAWSGGKAGGDDAAAMAKITRPMQAVVAALDDVVAHNPIDPARIYLSGTSMGGYGSWDLGERMPERFAALAPICGGGDASHAGRLVGLPIWAWHGDADTIVPVDETRRMIAVVTAAGGTPKYTELKGVNHDSWTAAYNGPGNLLSWMFAQVKAAAASRQRLCGHEARAKQGGLAMQTVLTLIVLLEFCDMGSSHDVTKLYEAKRYNPTFFDNAKEPGEKLGIAYRLLKPARINANQRYPLVLFLHGAGERGNDNKKQLEYLPTWLASDENRRSYPCFLLAPQCPDEMKWSDANWSDSESVPLGEMTEPMRAVIGILDEVTAKNLVDPAHVYLTGLSMGGYGSWELAARMPERFAALVPICGGGDEKQAGKLAGLPIWAWHGDADQAVPVERSRRMIAAIKEAGGSPKYTELKDVGHDSWTAAYTGPDNVLPWMFKQVKAQAAAK